MGSWSKWLPALIFLGVVLLFSMFVGIQYPGRESAGPIPYSQVKTLVAQQMVVSVTMRGSHLAGILKSPIELAEGRGMVRIFESEIPAVGDPTLLPAFEAAGV